METRLYNILKNIGFTKQETNVYLACLSLGRSSVIQIAGKAGIKRTTTYNIIESLLEKGVLSKHQDRKGQKFLAESPEKILTNLRQNQKDLSQILPNLIAMAGSESEFKPEVKFYQGKEGLKAVYEDTLNSCEKGYELAGYFSGEDAFNFLPDYTRSYVKRRVAKGIKAKAIAIDSKIIRKHIDRDKKELRRTKLVSKQMLPISIEKDIYKDKVAFMNFKGFPFGVIIKSPQIAKSERAIFELLWKKLPDK